MKLKAPDHVLKLRSSVSITVVSVLIFLLTILQALPAPFNESKWVLLAIAAIGAILVFLNSPDRKKEVKNAKND